MNQYQFVRNNPVARFYYKGDHTHPVRRTVLIINQNNNLITGYELREGADVRNFKDAPIKSYRRNKIAKVSQIDRRRVLRRAADESLLQKSTLTRSNLQDFIKFGA